MRLSLSLAVGLLMLATAVTAQEKTSDDSAAEAELQERFDAFAESMKKIALVGAFTVDADESQDRKPERYEISHAVKLDEGDKWSIFARIKYAKYDVTLPVPVEVKWAGKTPVITVDEVTLPGLGTFDARVLIHDDKYAGTWRHGEVGGLMFGKIEKQAETEKANSE